jgi:hypothetical protein
MLTLKNLKGKRGRYMDTAPYLRSTKAIPIMEFVTEYTDYARSVLSHNEATTEKALHEPVKRFLDRIKPDVQEMILKDTLPTNFPCLQELYPASRRFT